MKLSSVLVLFSLITVLPAVNAQSVTAQVRARAIANCNANRGTDCSSAEGLKEWIDAEHPRPAGQRSAIQLQKLDAERQAQQQRDAEALRRQK